MAERKEGAPFRSQYGLPNEGANDTPRFRARLAGSIHLFELGFVACRDIINALRAETGASMGKVQPSTYAIEHFCETGELHDVLSVITIVHKLLPSIIDQQNFRRGVRRILQEENILFEIDDHGGIHPKVDGEFQRNVQASITALELPGFAGVKNAFEGAYNKLAIEPPDTKGCLQELFVALESGFKLKLGAPGLDSSRLSRVLTPIIDRKYSNADTATKQSEARFVDGFAKFVDSIHPYRHGHSGESVIDPPEDLTVALFSLGAAYLRWLVELKLPIKN